MITIEALRRMIAAFDTLPEHFNGQFTLRELVNIRIAWLLSESTLTPDEWTPAQVRHAAKASTVPRWYGGKPTSGMSVNRALEVSSPSLETMDQINALRKIEG